MIKSKEELKKVIKFEKSLYKSGDCYNDIKNKLLLEREPQMWKYIKALRISEYHYNNRNSIFHAIMYYFWHRRKNKIGYKLGFEIWENSVDEGLLIYHPSSIIINGFASIGKNCVFHGNNCIGNDGLTSECPTVGNGVEFGAGSMAIGNIYIADNVMVASGAVVVNSINEKNVVVAGIPARKIKDKDW